MVLKKMPIHNLIEYSDAYSDGYQEVYGSIIEMNQL